ncbi:MAG: hypothetical protein IJR00_11540 [Lachnospiraceae bacterium]|nr:hypothetical protein [Lachnospiraceae bacterium]
MKKTGAYRQAIGALLTIAMVCGLISCGGSGQSGSTAGESTAEAVSSAEASDTSTGAEGSTAETESATADTADASSAEDDAAIEALLAQMSLKDKVEQMMIVCYRVWKGVPADAGAGGTMTVENQEQEVTAVNVTELNDTFRTDLREHHYGGTILFAENCHDAEQTLRLVRDIQKTSVEGGGLPLIVAIDQEGGNVARLGFGTTGVGNMALAATGDPENARKMAGVYGEEMRLLGINTNYAPVLDVNNNPLNPVIGVRSFSDSPEVVSRFGLAYLQGLKETGTIGALKHFPGHGNTATDSHTGFPLIGSTYEELKNLELIPFQRAIDAGADMIMTAHIQYPQIEKETYTSVSTGEAVYLPATLSRTILTELLREDMGFTGVVVTDALEMAAIADHFKPEDVLSLAINGGADMLLLPSVTDAASLARVHEMTETAVALAENGTIDAERIEESVRRILRMKQQYGLLDVSFEEVTDAEVKAATEGTGSAAHRDTEFEIAVKALTLVKNENNAFPLRPDGDDTTLFLFADSAASRVATGELAKRYIAENGMILAGKEIRVLVNTKENGAQCLQEALAADHCVLINRMYGAANLDPANDNGFSTAVFDNVIRDRKEAGKQTIVISCQLPYDAARFPDADAILLCYNSAVMREIPPDSGAGSAFAPNLAAALMSCFTGNEVEGKLPVNLPALDDSMHLAEEVLFEREWK